MTEILHYDVVVVGAGPAGSAAALAAATAGARVLLLERGPFPGSKNVYGGVIYPRILERYIPNWGHEVPVERWITRRTTMLVDDLRSISVDFSDPMWSRQERNGATVSRSVFDPWLATKAQEAGADLVCSTLVTGLTTDSEGRVTGVTTDRDSQVAAGLVIAADGVNSLLAKEGGLYPNFNLDNLTLGAKEVHQLARSEIDSLFGISDGTGVDIEILGCTKELAGGGFIYTNGETISVGIVVSLRDLQKNKVRPEELIAGIKLHPSLSRYFESTRLVEYAAHMIPEGGYRAWPKLSMPGLVVAGDAAATCLATGLWLEGVNMAIGSGLIAGEFAAKAVTSTSADYREYDTLIKASFVGKNHQRFQRAPHLIMSNSVQHVYPKLSLDFASKLFTVTDPVEKPGVAKILRGLLRESKVSRSQLGLDLFRAWRAFK